MNYYNEFDPFAASWLRELIKDGLIPQGEVDERSITEVAPRDLDGFTQCHFFAGIGGWSYALQLANWPNDRPVWTGSCPCQPFSVAGKGKGTSDERHLWPVFRWLIAQCRPSVVFGEQVASKAGRAWLGGVQADLEALGYAVGKADICAAGIGAPMVRQRLWWGAVTENGLAQSDCLGRGRRSEGLAGVEGEQQVPQVQTAGSGSPGGLAHSDDKGSQGWNGAELSERSGKCAPWAGGSSLWWPCRDGKSRRIPTEPSIQPLVDGVPNRVGLLRGAGNAIVPQVAAEFITAFMESNK